MADRVINTGFDTEFGGPLQKFRDFLASKGIQTNIISGVRDDEDQRQLVANRDATLARRPLPYPDRGPVHVAAPVGSSAHEYGEAADLQPVNPADAGRMHALAKQFGLQMPNWGGADPYHVQLANWQQAASTQPPNTPWDQTNPANVPTRMAMNVEADAPVSHQPANLLNRGTGSRPDFYNTAMMHESGGQNIPNAAGGAAGGYYQFMPPTWAGIRAARPDLNLPENAMAASRDQQTAAYHEMVKQNVAALQNAGLPISDKNAFMASFLGGGGASKFLNQMGRDPNANAAALFPAEAKQNPGVFYANGKPRSLNDVFAFETAKFGAGNTTGYGPNSTTLNSVPAAATAPEPGIGSGYPTPAQPNAVATTTETPPPQNAGDYFKKFITRPPPTTDAKGNEVQGKSPLENLANSFKPAGGQQQAAAPEPATFAPVQDPMAQLAGPSSQMFQAVSQAASRPLSWTSTPYGSMAGQQYGMPGTTLNSRGDYYG